jgi:hypothetical protein
MMKNIEFFANRVASTLNYTLTIMSTLMHWNVKFKKIPNQTHKAFTFPTFFDIDNVINVIHQQWLPFSSS